MERKKLTLAQFKREYPLEYAELSEQKGCKDESLRYYSRSRDAEEVIHAAELAITLVRYDYAKRLLKKATRLAEEDLAECQREVYSAQMDPEGSGMTGAAMGFWNSQDKNERIKQKISELEAELRTK